MAVEAGNEAQSEMTPGTGRVTGGVAVPGGAGREAPAAGAAPPSVGDVPAANDTPPANEETVKPPGVGVRLAAARERKGFSVLQVAERLHIDPQVVENIEAENFQPLGAPVYVRGHIRRYAELVGEQGSELQDMFSKSVSPIPPDLRQVPKVTAPDETGRLLIPAIYGLLGFLLVGAVWWVLSLSGKAAPTRIEPHRVHRTASEHPASAPAAVPAPVPEPPATASAPAEVPAPTPSASNSAAGAVPGVVPGHEIGVGPAHEPAAAPAAAPAGAPPPTQASVSPVVKPLPVPPAPAPLQAAPAAPIVASAATSSTPAPARPPADTELTLRFTTDSYAEVYDANGKRLFADVGSARSVRTLRGKAPLKVMLGNGPGVGVDVNGHHTAIDATVGGNGEAHFIVQKDGHLKKSGG